MRECVPNTDKGMALFILLFLFLAVSLNPNQSLGENRNENTNSEKVPCMLKSHQQKLVTDGERDLGGQTIWKNAGSIVK